MRILCTFSVVSIISATAFAETTTTPPSVNNPFDSSTRVSLRINLDPFYKNLNDAAKNFKTPKVESLRLGFDRNFGKYSKADVGIFLHDLESQENMRKDVWYNSKTTDGKVIVNTGTIRYFHFLFEVPAVSGLQVGYVRELEPGLYGYTDRAISSTTAEAPSFTGHLGRVEGYRIAYKLDPIHKLTYHAARNPDQNEYSLGTKPSDTTWYHKLTYNTALGDTAIETGLGLQGKWMNQTDSSKLKYDNFLHIVVEHKMPDVKIKTGLAYDNYSVLKTNADNSLEASVASATTLLAATTYNLFPNTLSLIGEIGMRMLKLPSDKFIDFTKEDKPSVNSSNEATVVLGGMYHVDEKLSLVPSYNFYWSNRAQANAGNMTGNALLTERRILESGAERKAATSEHALAFRVRYDY